MDRFHLLFQCSLTAFASFLLSGCDQSPAPSLPSYSPDYNALNALSGRVDSLGVWRGTAFQGMPPGRLETMVSNCTQHSAGGSSGYCTRWYLYTRGLPFTSGTTDYTYGGCKCSIAGGNDMYCQRWKCLTVLFSADVCRFKHECQSPGNTSCEYRKDCHLSQTRPITEVVTQFEPRSDEFAFVAPDGGDYGWWRNAPLCIVLGDLQGSVDHQQAKIATECSHQEWFRRAEHDELLCACEKPADTLLYCAKWSCEKAAPQGVDAELLAFERRYPHADDLNASTWNESYDCHLGGKQSCLEYSGTMRSWLGGAVSRCTCDESSNCICDRYSLPPMMPWWFYEGQCLTFLTLLVLASCCTARQAKSKISEYDNFAIRLCIVSDVVIATVCLYSLGLYGLLTLSLPSLCVMYVAWMLPSGGMSDGDNFKKEEYAMLTALQSE